MDLLLDSQNELHGRIARTWENLKKTGQQNVTIDLVRTALTLLEKRWARLDEQHNTLMHDYGALLKEHDYVKKDFLGMAESQYITQRSHLLHLERQFLAGQAEAASASAPTTGASSPAATPTTHSLPRIELPKFSGKFEDWPAFQDLFTSMVIRQTALSSVEKLHYLKTSVLGDAESLLQNLPTTGDNFQAAWDTLRSHYENKRLLVRSYINAFLELPKARTHSVPDLRKIFHGVTTTVSALKGIGRPITSSEDLFVHIVVSLLDPVSRREWDKTLRKSTDPPSYDDLHTFLAELLTSEEALATPEAAATTRQLSRNGRTVRVAQPRTKSANPGRPCPVCKAAHFLAACDEYRKRSPQGRKELVAFHNRCHNCLGRHEVNSCSTTKSCLLCSGRHHTTLHEAFVPSSPTVSVHVAKLPAAGHDAAILATARVWIRDSMGRDQLVRVLIDPGAESSLITESLAQRLRLRRSSSSLAIYGYTGECSGTARGRATLTLSAHNKSFAYTMHPLVVPKLSVSCGSYTSDHAAWRHVQGLQLADPEFTARDPVELLLGAGAYGDIVLSRVRRGKRRDPVAQHTRLGWILLGGHRTEEPGTSVAELHCSEQENIATVLSRFWEWEEPLPIVLPPTEDEQKAEAFFLSTHTRLADGRFQVRLPFRITPPPQLASTRRAAQRMLEVMGKRFKRDNAFQHLYREFMEEYANLRHMSPAPQPSSTEASPLCYLPHHGILKTSGGNVKLRVVFNGSSRTPSGGSLNDHLLPGANLLPALPDVILRWRRHQFAFVADIAQMYRQIQMHPADRNYQRVLWWQGNQVAEFCLNTLTYGTSCAPFLAIRVLRQLAAEEESKYPIGAATLKQDAYVDDILSGASTVEAAIQRQQELSALCLAGGFPLRKWAASHSKILQGIPFSHRQNPSTDLELPFEEHSVLGLRWCTTDDTLTIKVTPTQPMAITKRGVLSQVSRLFDPLGWLAPVIITAKLILQATWLQRLDWDAPVAAPEATVWQQFMSELHLIEDIRIPRWFTGLNNGNEIELHGFADASERAYGAVVYIRVIESGTAQVSLVQAKSKVAPLKRVSLPRLELCAAALLSKLAARVREVMGLAQAPTHLWSDSAVTLAWIRGHPAKWTTFVANRVAEIQRESHMVQWHHVAGRDNPADCISRGLLPRGLADHPLWWHGPSFLQEDSSRWPATGEPLQDSDLPEQRPVRCLAVKLGDPEPPELLRFSSLRRLLRVTSWMRRWRNQQQATSSQQRQGAGLALQPEEIDAALTMWVRLSQGIAYRRELQDVREGRAVHTQSTLKTLTPILDQDGILRVGGRLKHSLLDADQQHPIILAPSSHLTQLVIDNHHRKTLHGGTQMTLHSIRRLFWIPRGRQLIKRHIHRCPKCLRWRAASPQPLMSNLPAARVTPSRPFLHCGVDYAGPIRLRTAKGRGHRSYKGFISIFVCFSTRAVHLEAASDYSAAAFLAAFRRFSSRRGLPTAMYSDQGTNFVDADTELRKLFSQAALDARIIANRLADDGVRWVFNPPAAPHFGGLWEAAVRSTKHHLRRVIGDATLTFEEMTTLLTEVEACLNSRPIQALSDDPEDLSVLTPGHFLVGGPLQAVPEPTLLQTSVNQLSRWRTLQRMRDHLWSRWSQEYLQSLMPRPKWWKDTGGIREGQLCIIKGECSSPTRWPLARVVQVHRGPDGRCRVVDLKTASGTLTRPVVKIIPLPDASSTPEEPGQLLLPSTM